MVPEANHNFMKIWGRLNVEKLPKGSYKVVVNNRKFKSYFEYYFQFRMDSRKRIN